MPSSSDLAAARTDAEQKDDEHTPLLRGAMSTSHMRIADGGTTPKPRLSRHHSGTGTSTSHMPFFSSNNPSTLRGSAQLTSLLRQPPAP